MGKYLELLDGNRSQSSTSQGISHSERETSGNNLTSEGSPLGTYLPNGLPIANPTSTNQTETDNTLRQSNKFRTYDEQPVLSVQEEIMIQKEGDYGTFLQLQVLLREHI